MPRFCNVVLGGSGASACSWGAPGRAVVACVPKTSISHRTCYYTTSLLYTSARTACFWPRCRRSCAQSTQAQLTLDSSHGTLNPAFFAPFKSSCHYPIALTPLSCRDTLPLSNYQPNTRRITRSSTTRVEGLQFRVYAIRGWRIWRTPLWLCQSQRRQGRRQRGSALADAQQHVSSCHLSMPLLFTVAPFCPSRPHQRCCPSPPRCLTW